MYREHPGERLLLFGLLALLGIGLIVGTTLGSVRRTLIVLVMKVFDIPMKSLPGE